MVSLWKGRLEPPLLHVFPVGPAMQCVSAGKHTCHCYQTHDSTGQGFLSNEFVPHTGGYNLAVSSFMDFRITDEGPVCRPPCML